MQLFLFLGSCLLAFLAGHMVNYSVIFLSLQWFNSHTIVGLGYGLCFGPPLILGWFAGVYCDRYSPRRVILVAQNSFFVALAFIWFAFNTQPASDFRLGLLLVAALFSGIGWSFVAPARFATLPYYVKNKSKITSATIALNLMVMMGFGLAPMLLKQIKFYFDWQAVLLTAGSMFAISTALLLPLSFDFKSKTTDKAYTEIKNSLLFVKGSPLLKQLLLLTSIAYLLMGPMQVILPSIAKDNLALSDVAQGYYLSLVAFSLIVGGLLAMILKNKGRLGWQLFQSIFFAGIGIGLLALIDNLAASVMILVLSSACGGIAISFIVAGLQRYSNDKHRGRIMSFYTIISQAIPAVSGVAAGLLAQAYSPIIAMMSISGLIVIALLIASYFLYQVRQLVSFS